MTFEETQEKIRSYARSRSDVLEEHRQAARALWDAMRRRGTFWDLSGAFETLDHEAVAEWDAIVSEVLRKIRSGEAVRCDHVTPEQHIRLQSHVIDIQSRLLEVERKLAELSMRCPNA